MVRCEDAGERGSEYRPVAKNVEGRWEEVWHVRQTEVFSSPKRAPQYGVVLSSC